MVALTEEAANDHAEPGTDLVLSSQSTPPEVIKAQMAKQRGLLVRKSRELKLAQEHLRKEAELVDFFKKQGLEVYVPDVAAFRDFAQKKYLASDLAKSWPAGMVDKINAL